MATVLPVAAMAGAAPMPLLIIEGVEEEREEMEAMEHS